MLVLMKLIKMLGRSQPSLSPLFHFDFSTFFLSTWTSLPVWQQIIDNCSLRAISRLVVHPPSGDYIFCLSLLVRILSGIVSEALIKSPGVSYMQLPLCLVSSSGKESRLAWHDFFFSMYICCFTILSSRSSHTWFLKFIHWLYYIGDFLLALKSCRGFWWWWLVVLFFSYRSVIHTY